MKKLILISVFTLLSIIANAQTFHLYGGRNHDVYLGCLNCSKYESNSIWNTYGDYGSKYSSTSIWNKYGTYGSKYDSYSPWNSYSDTPPVIVDKSGNFYGYLTTNKYKNKRAEFKLAEILCEYYDLIADDVSKWYDKLF